MQVSSSNIVSRAVFFCAHGCSLSSVLSQKSTLDPILQGCHLGFAYGDTQWARSNTQVSSIADSVSKVTVRYHSHYLISCSGIHFAVFRERETG